MPLILILCRANICRSPLAEVLLATRLAATQSLASVRVESAGTLAQPERGMCALASAKAVSLGVATGYSSHRSRRMNPELLQAADLILTAESEQRGAAALMMPSARSRIFTLKEAAELASNMTVTRSATRVSIDTDDGLQTWVDSLHELREDANAQHSAGSKRPPITAWHRRLRLSRSTDVASQDIVDGHNLRERMHRATFADVEQAVERLVAGIAASTDLRGSDPRL